jgi:hypothetical protein
MPTLTHQIAGLDARVKDFLTSPLSWKAAISAANLRPDKGKKNKSSVRCCFILFLSRH